MSKWRALAPPASFAPSMIPFRRRAMSLVSRYSLVILPS